MKPLHSIAVALQRLVRRLPIWCEHEGCKRLRARGCYGFCRPCWAYGVRITWEALWNDDPAPPNAPRSATGGKIEGVDHE